MTLPEGRRERNPCLFGNHPHGYDTRSQNHCSRGESRYHNGWMKVHSELGPGLLESTYTACLQYELIDAGVQSSAQVGLPVVYRGIRLDLGYRMDLVVENTVVVNQVRGCDFPCPSGPNPFVP